jgi:hypothetical protein
MEFFSRILFGETGRGDTPSIPDDFCFAADDNDKDDDEDDGAKGET